MHIQFNDAIMISSGDENNYPGRTWKNVLDTGVRTPEDFIVKTRQNLLKIASKPIGKDLLELISKRHKGIGTKMAGKTVAIQNGWGTLLPKMDNTNAAATSTMEKYTVRRNVVGQELRMAGKGSSVVVKYNPALNYSIILKLNTPAYIALAHELVHAYHFMSGNMDGSDTWHDPLINMNRMQIIEEAKTVGAGSYENTRISENAIRREHRLPLRKYYRVPGDCTIINTRSRSNAVF